MHQIAQREYPIVAAQLRLDAQKEMFRSAFATKLQKAFDLIIILDIVSWHSMKEIERKFLVNDEIQQILLNLSSKKIQQGYLAENEKGVVRVRTKGEKGFLTIKAANIGVSRDEFEYEIPFNEAEEMLKLFCSTSISKERYTINYGQHLWEVDVFHGKLEGLIVAEIELQSETEEFELPHWIDKEVSDDKRYFNSNLIHLSSAEALMSEEL